MPSDGAIDRLPLPCYILDRDFNIRHLNPAAEQLFGFTNAEAVGRSPGTMMIPGEQWEASKRRLEQLALGRAATVGRAECRDRSGRRIVCQWHNSALHDERGFAGSLSVAIDVTESAHVQEVLQDDLRASEERYRKMFESNPLPMLVFDRATLGILAVNDAAVARYGWSREEFLAMTIRDIRPTEDVSALEREVRDFGASPHHAGRWRHQTRKGEILDVEISQHPLDFAGRPAAMVVINDVTTQAALEDQLRQAQKMEAVGQLTGGIAHDLNNILTAVIAHADLAAAAVPDGAGELKDDIVQARAAATRGADLIRKLLAFSRRERLRLKALPSAAFLLECAATLRRMLPETIEIVTDVPEDLPDMHADAAAIEQVLLNLTTNARDAMPQGGTLRIAADAATLSADQVIAARGRQGSFVRLTVSDTGVGMSADVRDRMFEPFFTTKQPEFGTGLGLSMVYGLVKQHRGLVFVASEPGQGTTVQVYLPVADGSTRVTRSAAAATPARGSEAVMVVEDEEPIRRAARRVLERHGYKVIVAADGAEALEKIQAGERVDLVISDAIMPRMGGLALSQVLAREHPEMAFLLTSGYTGAEVAEQHGGDTGLPFLAKPWTMTDLLSRVREVLDEA